MFEFKQFKIHQDRCAQKVTEIACIQGAWTPIRPEQKQVLDIGSGTGLLSLMLAQRFPHIKIDSLELDALAFSQLEENINVSPFANQINPLFGDVKTFDNNKKYDFIIVNPPFHEKQLTSNNSRKNQAWHSDELNLFQLITAIKRLIHLDGVCSILLPSYRQTELIQTCGEFNLYPSTILEVAHSEHHPVKLNICLLSSIKNTIEITRFDIKKDQEYTGAMRSLMQAFYQKC